jgi:hypothetical protein
MTVFMPHERIGTAPRHRPTHPKKSITTFLRSAKGCS